MPYRHCLTAPSEFPLRRNATRWSGLMLMVLLAASASADVVFYTNSSQFAATASAYTFLGTEDWSSATGTAAADVADPLQPGVPNGPFPNGSNPVTGVQAQSNAAGDNPVDPQPGSGLFYGPAGFAGLSGNIQPSQQISANAPGEGFDLIFGTTNNPSTVKAVSLSPMYYRLSSNNSGAVTVRVYNQTNAPIGSITISNVADCLETAYVGLATTNADTIGRINLWTSATDTTGADNISVYVSELLPCTLHADTWATNTFTFTLTGQPGSSYIIQSSSDLTNWTALQTNLLSGNSLQLQISASTKSQFYRAQLVQ